MIEKIGVRCFNRYLVIPAKNLPLLLFGALQAEALDLLLQMKLKSKIFSGCEDHLFYETLRPFDAQKPERIAIHVDKSSAYARKRQTRQYRKQIFFLLKK